MVELYDAGAVGAGTSKLVNLSARADALTGDEAQYALVVQNIKRSGDWVYVSPYPPTPYLQKPPLYFWLTASTYDALAPSAPAASDPLSRPAISAAASSCAGDRGTARQDSSSASTPVASPPVPATLPTAEPVAAGTREQQVGAVNTGHRGMAKPAREPFAGATVPQPVAHTGLPPVPQPRRDELHVERVGDGAESERRQARAEDPPRVDLPVSDRPRQEQPERHREPGGRCDHRCPQPPMHRRLGAPMREGFGLGTLASCDIECRAQVRE